MPAGCVLANPIGPTTRKSPFLGAAGNERSADRPESRRALWTNSIPLGSIQKDMKLAARTSCRVDVFSDLPADQEGTTFLKCRRSYLCGSITDPSTGVEYETWTAEFEIIHPSRECYLARYDIGPRVAAEIRKSITCPRNMPWYIVLLQPGFDINTMIARVCSQIATELRPFFGQWNPYVTRKRTKKSVKSQLGTFTTSFRPSVSELTRVQDDSNDRYFTFPVSHTTTSALQELLERPSSHFMTSTGDAMPDSYDESSDSLFSDNDDYMTGHSGYVYPQASVDYDDEDESHSHEFHGFDAMSFDETGTSSVAQDYDILRPTLDEYISTPIPSSLPPVDLPIAPHCVVSLPQDDEIVSVSVGYDLDESSPFIDREAATSPTSVEAVNSPSESARSISQPSSPPLISTPVKSMQRRTSIFTKPFVDRSNSRSPLGLFKKTKLSFRDMGEMISTCSSSKTRFQRWPQGTMIVC